MSPSQQPTPKPKPQPPVPPKSPDTLGTTKKPKPVITDYASL